MTQRFLAGAFNRDGFPVVNYRVYGLVSDGDIMEGILSEAASLAGHLGLGRPIYVYLDNGISIDGPRALVLSRQAFPVIDRSEYASEVGLRTSGHILAEATGGPPELVLLGTGSEVHLLLSARRGLEKEGATVRVVSLPCWELFEAQGQQYIQYIEEVLHPAMPKLAVEAGVTLGWERHTGSRSMVVGMDCFGGSAPAVVLFKELGFTVENILSRARRVPAKCYPVSQAGIKPAPTKSTVEF